MMILFAWTLPKTLQTEFVTARFFGIPGVTPIRARWNARILLQSALSVPGTRRAIMAGGGFAASAIQTKTFSRKFCVILDISMHNMTPAAENLQRVFHWRKRRSLVCCTHAPYPQKTVYRVCACGALGAFLAISLILVFS